MTAAALENRTERASQRLAGATRAEIVARADRNRDARTRAQDARGAALALDVLSRRARLLGDAQHRQAAARTLAERFTLARPDSSPARSPPTARASGCCGWPPAHRFDKGRRSNASISRTLSGHALRVEPGRLHPELLVLPHRHAAAGAQPDRGRDRRPGAGRPRPVGEFPARSPPPTGSRPGQGVARLSNIVFMGMGEPLYNFDPVVTRSRSSPTATACPSRSAGSPFRPPASFRRSRGSAPSAGPSSRSRCTPPTMRCATCSCPATANIRSKRSLKACRAYPGLRMRGA